MILVFHPGAIKSAVLVRSAAWATAQNGGGRTGHPSVDPAVVPQAHVEPRSITLPVADAQGIRFTRLSTDDGLSQTRVLQIVQDDQGFMWFGSQYRLNRFDGYKFKVFKHEPGRTNSLSGVFISSIDRLRSLYRKGAPPKRELVVVNEVIGEMLVLLRSEASRYAISMRTELAAELPEVTADRVQMQQVLMNLMLNGIEAMRETGGVLTIKSELSEDGQLVIAISDTGVGLPADQVDQIFNALFTTKPQGSGMGLAICRSIVESHSGRLWASANHGRGATFQFTLPAEAVTSSPSIA